MALAVLLGVLLQLLVVLLEGQGVAAVAAAAAVQEAQGAPNSRLRHAAVWGT